MLLSHPCPFLLRSYYDSMLAKVIASAPTFPQATQKMQRALSEFQVRVSLKGEGQGGRDSGPTVAEEGNAGGGGWRSQCHGTALGTASLAHAPCMHCTRCDHHLQIRGIKTNIPFLENVLRHPTFLAGDATTAFIEQHSRELFNFEGHGSLRWAAGGCLTGR